MDRKTVRDQLTALETRRISEVTYDPEKHCHTNKNEVSQFLIFIYIT
jgi:hypothetical protein